MSVATQLGAMGWRVDTPPRFTRAVQNFQRGWCLGSPLVVDGIPGPKTCAALNTSHTNMINNRGTASAHFSFREFACKCGGKHSDCVRIYILASHIRRLEIYRAKIGRPVVVVSGYRCAPHNKAVGGASSSQHMFGTATDISGCWKIFAVNALHLFSGLGYQSSTGNVVHVDSRDLTVNNPTHSTTAWPAMWKYAT